MLLEWDEFAAKAEEMARRNPLHTRYVVKYKHAEGKMTLKATDNEEVRRRPMITMLLPVILCKVREKRVSVKSFRGLACVAAKTAEGGVKI